LLGNGRVCGYSEITSRAEHRSKALPEDVDQLHKLVVELCEKLKHEASEKDKYRSLLRELLDAERNRKSEQLSKDQLTLFETLWKANQPDEEEESKRTPSNPRRAEVGETGNQEAQRPTAASAASGSGASGARPGGVGETLQLLRQRSAPGRRGTSERYEFIPQ